ncbi:MAG: hypothetical protein LBJ76_00825 [Candidatus Accumulibacter sp.]|jgi:hypothetical protein|nr:hypothetical protein [Accumulibacter sp.]
MKHLTLRNFFAAMSAFFAVLLAVSTVKYTDLLGEYQAYQSAAEIRHRVDASLVMEFCNGDLDADHR